MRSYCRGGRSDAPTSGLREKEREEFAGDDRGEEEGVEEGLFKGIKGCE